MAEPALSGEACFNQQRDRFLLNRRFSDTCLSHLRIAEIIMKGARPDEVHDLITYEHAQINRKSCT